MFPYFTDSRSVFLCSVSVGLGFQSFEIFGVEALWIVVAISNDMGSLLGREVDF